MKKLFALLLAFALVFSMAACGAKTDGDQSKAPAAGESKETVAAKADTESGKPYAGVTINFMADSRSEYDKMLTRINEFQAATGITVNYTTLQENELRTKTALEVAADSTDIDVVMLDYMYLADYAKSGYLANISELMDKVGTTFSTDDYIPSFIDACSVDGKLYGVPLYQDCNIMTLRGDLMEKYNLEIPETYDELMEVAKVISENEEGVAGIVMRGAAGAGMNEWTWPTFLSGFGGKYYDDTLTASLNTAEAQEALTYYVDILTKYGPKGAANYSYTEVQNDIMQGKAAIMIDSATLTIRCEDPAASTVAGKLVYAPVPTKTVDGKADTGFYSWLLTIPANSAKTEAAALFVEWLTSADISGACGFSAPNSALENTYNINGYDGTNLYDVMVESLERATVDYRPCSAVSNEVGEAVSVAISEALSGEKTPADALATANEAVQKSINKLK